MRTFGKSLPELNFEFYRSKMGNRSHNSDNSQAPVLHTKFGEMGFSQAGQSA